jgi:uncharacterized protein YybS (DUF2232 family)
VSRIALTMSLTVWYLAFTCFLMLVTLAPARVRSRIAWNTSALTLLPPLGRPDSTQ